MNSKLIWVTLAHLSKNQIKKSEEYYGQGTRPEHWSDEGLVLGGLQISECGGQPTSELTLDLCRWSVMAYETKLPRQASSSTVTEDFSEDSEVPLPVCSCFFIVPGVALNTEVRPSLSPAVIFVCSAV